jgi:hypothetical protein
MGVAEGDAAAVAADDKTGAVAAASLAAVSAALATKFYPE